MPLLLTATLLLALALTACASAHGVPSPDATDTPFVMVLGIAQDAGIPQAGAWDEPGWTDPTKRRLTACLAIVDPGADERFLIDATPDFREQLERLHRASPARDPDTPPLSGILLTHAHIGHYTGLMFLGHESMGAHGVPVYAMPEMRRFLETNAPWSLLVSKHNVVLEPLAANVPVPLTPNVTVTPIPVPHRHEFSETVGFVIHGPGRTVLYIPDIDAWEQLDAQGVRIEDLIGECDVAYLDGTFFQNYEVHGRDMTGFPHPFIAHSIERFSALPEAEREKIRFIHLNHTNPAQFPDSEARRTIEHAGMHVAEPLERVEL